jgi:DNA repair exonuclease SbcCD ATPase subunit/DNA repair exonuclease SbcCD nuclease subunit
MKIVHVSDIHVKNFKFHKQYNEIFADLYEKVRDIKPDIIVNTGDTAHTKLDLSPAYFEMTAKLFENLASIAPLHVILGNHDLNLSNKDRQDAVTPIVEALKNPNIILHKYSEKFNIGDFNFHVLSIVDEENWDLNVDESKVNIALFHGSVEGSQTDMNFTMTHGDIGFDVLEKFDYALLGDIHKTNQSLDFAGRCRYPGSLIQQNHGETNDKGFLVWNIEDKENFFVEHVQLNNPYPFCTIELTEDGKIPPNVHVPPNARLRLLSRTNLPAELMKKASDVAKEKFKPESISFLAKNANKSETIMNGKVIAREDLRNPKVQERLISDYLADYKVPEEVLKQVYEINSRYNSQIQATEEVCRNVNWKLKHVEWDNLFNYGEGNSIDFSKLNGVVGIFGKNYSGKSSIIDSILYSIFNTTSKNERKTTNVINQTKSFGKGKAVIQIDDFDYYIDRKAEKYTKKLKGEVSEEAKTELSLNCFDAHSGQWEQMNQLTRTDTDKYIRKMFGTIDDFMLTSFSSQLDSMTFIREGSTRRKEILARFLDLDIFDAKFKMAKEESSNLKGLLKKLEGKEFDSDIAKSEILLDQLNQTINDNATLINEVKSKQADIQATIQDLNNQISECGVESIDIDIVLKQKNKLVQQLDTISTTLSGKNKELEEAQALFKKINNFIDGFDIKQLKEQKDFISKKQQELKDLHVELSSSNGNIDRLNHKLSLLKEIPCGTQFPTCKFLKDAYDAQSRLPSVENTGKELQDKHSKLAKEVSEFDITQVNNQISKYDQIVLKKSETEKKVLKLEVEINKLENDVKAVENNIVKIEKQIEIYKKNNELFEKLDSLNQQLVEAKNEASKVNKQFAKLDEELIETYIKVGSTKNKIETLKNERTELENLRNEFAAYDYYMRCMHPNGISYEIIKKKLPVINAEIAKVLSNIVEFEVFFEDDGTKLNVFIKHPKYDARPIEMGSGAEKTIAAMAIRLALLQVSNLPKCNFMVMDEPGTALDSDNMEGFIRILDMVKSYYDVVLLISHMDALKDIADTIITIDKKDGYAYVSV